MRQIHRSSICFKLFIVILPFTNTLNIVDSVFSNILEFLNKATNIGTEDIYII